jgi:hypothetical protein
MVSFALCEELRSGADTGGGTTALLRAAGPVNGGGSRRMSRGEGGIIGAFIATSARESRDMSVGAGAMMVA